MGSTNSPMKTDAPRPAPFRAIRHWIDANPTAARWILAGPGAVVIGLVTMMAMPVWLPAGAAGVNNIAFPILLTPLLWAVPFFYATLTENLPRAAVLLLAATLIQGLMIAFALT